MILSSRHIDATRDSVFLLLWFRSLLRRGNRTAFLLCCRRLCLFLRRLLLRSLWRFVAHDFKVPSLVSRTQELKKPGSQIAKTKLPIRGLNLLVAIRHILDALCQQISQSHRKLRCTQGDIFRSGFPALQEILFHCVRDWQRAKQSLRIKVFVGHMDI